jgi:hypothetical protein
MLQGLRILVVYCIALMLLGCAASPAKLTGQPITFSDIKPTPAKEILFNFDVSIENNPKNRRQDSSVEQWTQYAEILVKKIELLGVKADFNIKFENFSSLEKLSKDATHIVSFTEERGTLYGRDLINVRWSAAVLQKIPSAELNRVAYKSVSGYKYEFAGWDCFMNLKLHPEGHLENCLGAHADFQIEQLRKAGIIK